MHIFWGKKCKIYYYLPWYYYFVTSIIYIIFFINLNIFDIDVFSPAGKQHQVNIYLLSLLLF